MRSGVNIKAEQEEEGQIAGIKAFVEVYRFNIDKNIKYLCRAQPNADSAVYKRLILCQEKAAEILKTIAVTAGIVYSAGVYAYGFLKCTVLGRAAVFQICHIKASCRIIEVVSLGQHINFTIMICNSRKSVTCV